MKNLLKKKRRKQNKNIRCTRLVFTFAKFVSKVKNVSFLGPDTALLRAIAGMVPPGQSNINPNVNTHHTLVAVEVEGNWRVKLFQNTPAQFHGRPELVEQMTEELRQLLK